MNCIPHDPVNAVLTWGIFGTVLLSSLRSAEDVVGRMAESMGRQRPKHFATSLTSGKYHCILLVTMTVFLALLFCLGDGLLLSGLASLATFVIAGALEFPEMEQAERNPNKLKFWGAVQERLDPGVIAGFLSQRIWSTHFVVVVATVLISAIYLGFFGHLAIDNDKKKEEDPEDTHVVYRMFSRTLHMASYVALWTAYAVVLLREVSQVFTNDSFRPFTGVL